MNWSDEELKSRWEKIKNNWLPWIDREDDENWYDTVEEIGHNKVWNNNLCNDLVTKEFWGKCMNNRKYENLFLEELSRLIMKSRV